MILNRSEFIQYWKDRGVDCDDDGCPLWIPEKISNTLIKCEWFTETRYREDLGSINFWTWCIKNMDGDVRCFSCNEDNMWWGFTKKEDIVFWKLIWN